MIRRLLCILSGVFLVEIYCIQGFSAQEVVDYRAHLERAFEVMAIGTMRYERSSGMGLGKGRTTSIVSQQRNVDGTVYRKVEYFTLGKRIPRGELPPAVFISTNYYTDEGFTHVVTTRGRVRGIRRCEGVPRDEIPPGAGVTGIEKQVYESLCWIVRVERADYTEKSIAVEEYVVEQSTHFILRSRYFDANGRIVMVIEQSRFESSPVFPPDCFQLPKLDELKFASNGEEYVQALKDIMLQCALEGDAMEQTGLNAFQGSWLARRWNMIRRNPGRASFWGLLVISCLCLGTAGVLREFRR
jgi:hypothetical protein